MEVSVLSRCLGINNKLHPSKLHTKSGQYLPSAINVDVTDDYGIARRSGYLSLDNDLTNAHSLTSYMDQYLIYADGVNLYTYNIDSAEKQIICNELTPDLAISYTEIGEAIWLTNGVEQKVVYQSDSVVVVDEWDDPIVYETDNNKEIQAFPSVDTIHYYKGVLYGAVSGTNHLFFSLPFRPSTFDSASGFIQLEGNATSITSLGDMLLIGTDNGLFLLSGGSINDFQISRLKENACISISSITNINFNDSYRQGRFVLFSDGIFFIDINLNVTEMTYSVGLDWEKFEKASFGFYDGSYIFSGVIDEY